MSQVGNVLLCRGVVGFFGGISFGFGFIFITNSASFGLALSSSSSAELNLLVSPRCKSAEMVLIEVERLGRGGCVLV